MSQQRRRGEQVQAAFIENLKRKPDRMRAKLAALGQLPAERPKRSTSTKRRRAKR